MIVGVDMLFGDDVISPAFATEGFRWRQFVHSWEIAIVDVARAHGLPPMIAARLAADLATEADIADAMRAHSCADVVPPDVLAREAEIDELLRAWGSQREGSTA